MKGGQKKLALFFFIIFVFMINEVRNAVLAFLNKNNYGYITPQDFNLYAKQAQLDLFEDLFFQYNYQVNKENARQSGTGYADIKKGIEEDIDIFSQDVILINSAANLYSTQNASNSYALPSDYYFINKVYYRPFYTIYNALTSGVGAYQLISVTGDLSSIKLGDIVINHSTRKTAFVVSIDPTTPTIIGISEDIFPFAATAFGVYNNEYITEIERMSQKKINSLISSTLTRPTLDFPVYSVNGNNAMVYPVSIATAANPQGGNNYNYVYCQYIRYPKDPKWTFQNITGGEPVFDQSQSDYQDFELPQDLYTDLVLKILQYSGVSIREIDVVNYASTQEKIGRAHV